MHTGTRTRQGTAKRSGSRHCVANRWARLQITPHSRAMPRLYASNRRDGARLLSSSLVIAGAGLVRIDHPVGQLVTLLAGLISLYWWQCYRQLDH
jgi:hypothetical protein